MFKFKKSISIMLLVCLSVTFCLALSACAGKKELTNKYLVYFTNINGDDIVYREYKIKNAEELTADELIQVLIGHMFETDIGEEEQYRCTKPENVVLNSFNVTDNLVEFDFDQNYYSMTKVQEIMLRAATVLTVIQVPEITRVKFTIEGEPLTDGNGMAIGTMSADDFVNVLLNEEGMLKQETDLTIYFTDDTGTKLIPAKYHFTIKNNNLSMEEYILQQLKAGPVIGSTYRTMSQDVKILSVVTADYVCYVNFESDFLEQEQPASDEILIYSIVNSLCSLPYVRSVQFRVEGSSDVFLHTVTDLSKPFTRNRALEQ